MISWINMTPDLAAEEISLLLFNVQAQFRGYNPT